MVETKISLNLLVPGTKILSSQECEENPKNSYDEHKVSIYFTVGKGKNQREKHEFISIKTKRTKLVHQNINICYDAYRYMLSTPTSPKLAKIWNNLSIDEKLRKHFNLIASDLKAVSYSYKVFND
jgi:hypothetical protein